MSKKFTLSVGMPTYDDYDGLFFSIQAIRMYHAEVLNDIQFIVVDNNPTSAAGKANQHFLRSVPNCQYITETGWKGPWVKDIVMRAGSAPYALCMDCHILLFPGVLKRLLDFYESLPENDSRDPSRGDLFQGPLVYNNLTTMSTNFEPVWRGEMWGTWHTDSRGTNPDLPPFQIPMQGMGLFTCAKQTWHDVGGFNRLFSGFGGEEGYIHAKFRKNGRKCWCLPFMRWMHRFDRPAGVPFRLLWEDKVRNYFLGFLELDLDPAPIIEHFASVKKVPVKTLMNMLESARREIAAQLGTDEPPPATPNPESLFFTITV